MDVHDNEISKHTLLIGEHEDAQAKLGVPSLWKGLEMQFDMTCNLVHSIAQLKDPLAPRIVQLKSLLDWKNAVAISVSQKSDLQE